MNRLMDTIASIVSGQSELSAGKLPNHQEHALAQGIKASQERYENSVLWGGTQAAQAGNALRNMAMNAERSALQLAGSERDLQYQLQINRLGLSKRRRKSTGSAELDSILGALQSAITPEEFERILRLVSGVAPSQGGFFVSREELVNLAQSLVKSLHTSDFCGLNNGALYHPYLVREAIQIFFSEILDQKTAEVLVEEMIKAFTAMDKIIHQVKHQRQDGSELRQFVPKPKGQRY